jgi:triosephosphate isomerase (TIM)
MALPRPIVFGNWKMHAGLAAEADALASALAERKAAAPAVAGTLGVFPPATVLARVAERLRGTGILVGGQDCHQRPEGAFTGSVSAAMLKDAGAAAVILGHSERRQALGETDELVRAKAEAALAAGLLAVICVGETEAEWAAGRTLERIAAQVGGSVPRDAPPDRVVVAYEPVWAIGTGRTARSDDIARAHAVVRERLGAQMAGGGAVPVLYGGSVKPDNARDILATEGVDGALVGGASLDAAGLWTILEDGAGRR